MQYKIREMHTSEYHLLKDFLYDAIYIPNGMKAPSRSIIEHPELQVYIQNFKSSQHDTAFVAEVNGNVIAAAWVRIMNDYGHIDNHTPSLAMSVLQAYRGLGIGTALLSELLAYLKSQGYKNISLSVQKENYAVSMYKKSGFKIIHETNDEYIMQVTL